MASGLMIAFSLLSMPSLASNVCPIGAHDDSLTFSRVMQNFGRFLLAADRAALNGQGNPEAVGDEDLKAAVEGINVAMSCAQAVLDDSTEKLLPSKARELQGQAREAYVALLMKDMQAFSDGLKEFASIFEQLLQQPPGTRNFTVAYEQKGKVDELANKAHGDLSFTAR